MPSQLPEFDSATEPVRDKQFWGAIALENLWLYRLFITGRDSKGRPGRYFFILFKSNNSDDFISSQNAETILQNLENQTEIPLKVDDLLILPLKQSDCLIHNSIGQSIQKLKYGEHVAWVITAGKEIQTFNNLTLPFLKVATHNTIEVHTISKTNQLPSAKIIWANLNSDTNKKEKAHNNIINYLSDKTNHLYFLIIVILILCVILIFIKPNYYLKPNTSSDEDTQTIKDQKFSKNAKEKFNGKKNKKQEEPVPNLPDEKEDVFDKIPTKMIDNESETPQIDTTK